jgi:hypothetical protein
MVTTATILEAVNLVLPIKEIHGEMVSCIMIDLPSFMTIGIRIQAVLRFLLRNLRVCNIGITEWRDL